MTKLVLTVAPPGGGKSTLAKQFVAQGFVQVERDLIRKELFGSWYGKGVDEKAVTHVHEDRIRKALLSGKSVIVSDTNINPDTRNRLIALSQNLRAEPQVIEVAPTLLLEDYIKRNAERYDQTKVVPQKIVEQMYVSYREQFPMMAPVYDVNKPNAFVFDIDGTVADMTGVRGPFDWSKVGKDRPHHDVIDVLEMLRIAGNTLIAVSGRDEICRDATYGWLVRQGIVFEGLYMRPEGSQVRDSAIKHDLYHKYIAPHYNVLGVFDDRSQVVKTWRSMRLRCYQVAYGDF